MLYKLKIKIFLTNILKLFIKIIYKYIKKLNNFYSTMQTLIFMR